MKKYTPNPIDVSEMVIPKNLSDLIEKLSENVHDIWAAERMKNGWTYGSVRDDSKKESPCLVEYAELSEEEKNYDRKMVTGTLKTILKLGYTISSNDSIDRI